MCRVAGQGCKLYKNGALTDTTTCPVRFPAAKGGADPLAASRPQTCVLFTIVESY